MTTCADHNLLFGMLAVQMDLLSKDDLISGLQDWMLDKSRKLDEILLRSGIIDRNTQAVLLPLVELHVQRHGGDAKRSIAAISVSPSLAGDLESSCDAELKASLAAVSTGGLASDTDHPEATQWPATIIASDPDVMNIESRRFRLVRRHAEGGIGRVSVAEDLALSREVAFKELKPNFASNPSARKRFVVEAEITGRLEHPGIVPVYSAGRLHDDRPFYAMKFVHGTSLADAIHEFHDSYHDTKETERNLQFRKLLRRFIDVCNAVEYAHSRGVIHRDIKPANVMLGEFGETLVVDWGLAKTVGRREEAEDESSATLHPGSGQDVTATQSGTVLGTPYYMSPEQAAGEIERVDWLSDVYSLGATLYELLTGKAPVVADQPTDQATRLALSEVLRRVREGEYPRPRSVASHVPAALEAICLRAMNSDKVRRYESAKVLAADLELWLADEPVSVWVEPLDQQAQRAQSQLARAQLNLVVALAQTADIAFRGGDRNKADVLYAQARDRV